MRGWAWFCLKEMDTLDKFLFLFGLGFLDNIDQWTITEKLSQSFSTTHGISQLLRGEAPQTRPITPGKDFNISLPSQELFEPLSPSRTSFHLSGSKRTPYTLLWVPAPQSLSQPVTHLSISFLTHCLPTQPPVYPNTHQLSHPPFPCPIIFFLFYFF